MGLRRGTLDASSKSARKGAATMDKFVARLNIEHYRALLKTETDKTERERIARLLAEEEEKLRVAMSEKPKTPPKSKV